MVSDSDLVYGLHKYLKEKDSLYYSDSIHRFCNDYSAESQVTEMKYENSSIRFQPRVHSENTFPLLIITVSIILLILPKLLYKGVVVQIFQSIVSFGKFRLWLRDIDSLLRRSFVFLVPAFLLTFSLAVDIVFQRDSFGSYSFYFQNYIAILGTLTGYFILRYILIKLSSIVFYTKEIVVEYLNNINTMNTGLLLLLIPFVIFNFSKDALILRILMISLIGLIEIIRIIRGILLALDLKSYNLFYFFLYFCTTEILPLFVLLFWKVF